MSILLIVSVDVCNNTLQKKVEKVFFQKRNFCEILLTSLSAKKVVATNKDMK